MIQITVLSSRLRRSYVIHSHLSSFVTALVSIQKLLQKESVLYRIATAATVAIILQYRLVSQNASLKGQMAAKELS